MEVCPAGSRRTQRIRDTVLSALKREEVLLLTQLQRGPLAVLGVRFLGNRGEPRGTVDIPGHRVCPDHLRRFLGDVRERHGVVRVSRLVRKGCQGVAVLETDGSTEVLPGSHEEERVGGVG